jgi:S1-C subfamily serine protease
MKLKKKSLPSGQFLCAPFIAFLLLPPCGIPVANAQTPQQIAKKALAATVLLVMEDANGKPLGFGSGFFVDTNQIATNFHVIRRGSTRHRQARG